MSRNYNIAVIVGSLRKESVNRKAAEALVRMAPSNLDFDFINIGDLPLYDEDVETAGAPHPGSAFVSKSRVRMGCYSLLQNIIVQSPVRLKMPLM